MTDQTQEADKADLKTGPRVLSDNAVRAGPSLEKTRGAAEQQRSSLVRSLEALRDLVLQQLAKADKSSSGAWLATPVGNTRESVGCDISAGKWPANTVFRMAMVGNQFRFQEDFDANVEFVLSCAAHAARGWFVTLTSVDRLLERLKTNQPDIATIHEAQALLIAWNHAPSRQQMANLTETADKADFKTGPCVLSADEVEQLRQVLWKARSDIWQTARVSEYNLTGKDPNFPEDAGSGQPAIPSTVTRAGVDESYAVVTELEQATRMLIDATVETGTFVASQEPQFSEPWRESHAHRGFLINTGERREFECGWRQRAIECVNACAGLARPGKVIPLLRAAFRLTAAAIRRDR